MLWRRSWRITNVYHEPGFRACSRLRSQIPPLHSEYRIECISVVTDAPHNRQYRTLSKLEGSSIPHKNAGFAKQQSPKDKRGRILRTPEPWIDPSSLSDTLDAHRSANREGVARDGIPIQKKRRSQSKVFDGKSKRGPGAGTDFIHLPLAASVGQHQHGYSGECPPLLSEWRLIDNLSSRLIYPWILRSNPRSTTDLAQPAIQHLNDEIEACGQYFSPSASERARSNHVFDQIKTIILEFIEPGTLVDLIGSRATGIEGPVSDLDINIRLSTDTETTFRNLDKHIRQRNYAEEIVPHAFIKKAHVPIVSGTHIASGLEFQIQSTVAAYESLEVTKAYVAEYPKVHILFKVLRQLLLMRGLNTGVLGGVTSYPLLNMIVVSLKLADSHIPHNDIAAQLLHFLDFWAEFNFDKNMITYSSADEHGRALSSAHHAIDPISAIPRIAPKPHKTAPEAFAMSLEDPADPSNNLGRSTYGIKHVQACFIEARAQLGRAMQERDSHTMKDKQSVRGLKPLLAWCLGGNYTAFEEARLQLRRSTEHKSE